MRFDYLHSSRSLYLVRFFEFRIPERLLGGFFAVIGAVAVVAGAWGIQAYRLREALQLESVYSERHMRAVRELQRTSVYYDRVRALIELDRAVRRIAASGDADARTLAQVANHMPQHAWLTGISHDGTGLALEGHAKNLDVLGGVLQGLMHVNDLNAPTLVAASAEREEDQSAGVKYRIHVDGSAP